jgi:hypothetical protein
VQEVRDVGHEKVGVELERELCGFLGGGEVALPLRTPCELFEGLEPSS